MGSRLSPTSHRSKLEKAGTFSLDPSSNLGYVIGLARISALRSALAGRVAQLVRALVSHTRGPGFESLRDHSLWTPMSRVPGGLPLPSSPRRSKMIRFAGIRSFLAAVLVGAVVQLAPFQGALAQEPQTATVRTVRGLIARPEVVAQIRQRILSTGLTKELVHERLRAQGYPEDMFDDYFPGASQRPQEPTDEVWNALEELGIADRVDVDFLRMIQSDTTPRSVRDSLLRSRDSLTTGGPAITGRKFVVRADIADSAMRLDSGYNIFGLEIFRGQSKFEPLVAGPVDANYRLGPGDQLMIILSGDIETTYSPEVQREGFIVLPQVGQIYVANLTLEQLREVLFTRLGRIYSGLKRGPGATTTFTVSVTKMRVNQVFVLGEVDKPGSYQISGAGTTITALYAAGGPAASGSMRNVQIKRGGRLVGSLDVYEYLLRGDASKDMRLENGDIVFVPPRGRRVRIVGEILRPGTYELKEGETLADLIAAAGGFRADASRRRVQIERILPPTQRGEDGRDRVTMDVASEQLMNGHAPDVPIEGGDLVRVFPVTKRIRNTVTVKGNVWSPGTVGMTPGMTLSEAIRLAGGPRPDVFLGQVLVDRLRPDSTRVQLRAALRDSLGTVVNDFALQEDDVVQLFSVATFRPARYVAIGGAVKRPGRVQYRVGMTLRDVILLAGGLEEGAYLKEAEIARLPEDRSGTATAVTLRVPLDSSYLFDRRLGEAYVGAPGLPAGAAGAPEVPLKPYDNVLILQQPNWELQRVVTVQGEVNFPGQYALRSRNERLADVISRAGGLTRDAYPEGTFFMRRTNNLGRVALDVPKALKNRKSPENIILMDGDRITIPQRSFVVTVRGAVNAPNVVAYVPGADVDYYLAQAGGVSRSGDKGHAYVTQPSGKRQTKHRFMTLTPLPGSVVVVPEKDGSSLAWVNSLAGLLQTVVGMVTAYAVIKTTVK